MTFSDGNNDAGQGSGGVLDNTQIINLALTATNDAPEFQAGETITTTEDGGPSPAPAGEQTLGNLLDGQFNDPDAPAQKSDLAGVALTAFDDQGLGTWQVDLGGTAGWEDLSDFGTISSTSALLLDRDTAIRFEVNPDANTDGATRPSVSIHAVETDELTGGPSLPAFTTDSSSPETFDTDDDVGEFMLAAGEEGRSLVSADPVDIEAGFDAVNDDPTIISDTAEALTLNEDATPGAGTLEANLLSGSPGLADVDPGTTETLDDTTFGAGSITVSLDSGDTGDQLRVDDMLAGIVSGGVSGGVDGSDLVIDLATDATIAQVDAILQDLRYQHTSDTPPAGTRTFTITVADNENLDADGDDADSTNTDQSNTQTVVLNGSVAINSKTTRRRAADDTLSTERRHDVDAVGVGLRLQPARRRDRRRSIGCASNTAAGQRHARTQWQRSCNASDVISQADIDNSNLTYVPPAERERCGFYRHSTFRCDG
ncbi:MAG: hypothetical protein U5K73_11105 [Halofilum sp. (in: g-proteobacteria)]|nr:hypothetical protein [Halofilum sp. (in: g-proteobacteria)]